MVMILVTHILIALTSLVATTLLYISPSHKRLNISYALIAATLASGTVLVVETKSSMLSSCISGLVYLGIALTGALLGRKKLAKQEISSKTS